MNGSIHIIASCWLRPFSYSDELFLTRLVRALGVRSVHLTNVSPHGGKSFLVLQQWILLRERCEEREMFPCINAASVACIQFAKEKCLPPFCDARIALADAEGKPELVFWPFHTSNDVSEASSTGPEPDGLNLERLSCLARSDPEATNYRGSVLPQDSSVGSNDTDK